ncbi:MAG: ATP-binding protein [Myxococcota bacterium]|jgi:PAS domain S-box-containing protein|nr:ATP-binding protein [Myxococcota bacterium]
MRLIRLDEAQSFTLSPGNYVIGRDADADIVIEHAQVSRRHAILRVTTERCLLIDNDSSNGVFVNRRRINRRELLAGDCVRLGDHVELVFVDEEAHGQDIAQHVRELVSRDEYLKLREIAGRVTSLDKLEDTLRSILEQVIQQVGAARGFIALNRPDKGLDLDAAVRVGMPPLTSGKRSVYSHSVLQQCLDTRRQVILLANEQHLGKRPRSIIELELRSVMCAPLNFGGQLQGVLYVDSSEPAEAALDNQAEALTFSSTAQILFTLLADHAAIAIRANQRNGSISELEHAAQDYEQRYRQLIELAPLAIFTLIDGIVSFANPAALELTQLEATELIGRPAKQVFPECPCGLFESLPQPFSTEQRGLESECELRRHDGTSVVVALQLSELTMRGQPTVLVFARNITKQKQLESELRRAERLESLGLLAGGIAHDFNNILAALSGHVSLALDDESLPEIIKDSLIEANESLFRARHLTNQLMTFSRGGAPHREPTEFDGLVRQAAHFALHGSQTRLAIRLPDEPWLINGDQAQLSRVVHNLCLNAVQAMEGSGELRINAANLSIDASSALGLSPGPYVRLSISDEGPGIEEQHRARIFDPYFSTKVEGSGLGLATSYSIVSRHQGMLTFESREGLGTTFHVYLPALPELKPRKAVTKLEDQQRGGRVLVMDDDEQVRRILIRLLERIGFTPDGVADGEAMLEAWAKAKQEERPYRLCFVDLTVPGGLGGKEAQQRLLEAHPEAISIVVSGYCNDAVLAQPTDFGFHARVLKPFTRAELEQAIAEALAERSK